MTSITMVNVLMGKPPKIYYVLPESFAPGTLRFMKNIVPFFRGKCKRFVYYLMFYKETADN